MDAIQQSLNQMMEAFNKRLDDIEVQLPSGLSSPSEGLPAEFALFKAFVISTFRAVQSQISILAMQIDQGEMRARRKILLFHGLPEGQNEDTCKLLTKTISEKLKLTNFSDTEISRCHRMGRAAADKPRPVLFKLHDAALRDKIWSSKSSLKGSGITLSEFLTKTRHDVFLAARQHFGVTKCWTREGNIFVSGPEGDRHRIKSMDDLIALQAKAASASKASTAQAVERDPPKKRRDRPVKK